MSYGKHEHYFDRLLLVEKSEYESGEEHLTIYKQCDCGEVLKEVKTPKHIVEIRAKLARDHE